MLDGKAINLSLDMSEIYVTTFKKGDPKNFSMRVETICALLNSKNVISCSYLNSNNGNCLNSLNET